MVYVVTLNKDSDWDSQLISKLSFIFLGHLILELRERF